MTLFQNVSPFLFFVTSTKRISATKHGLLKYPFLSTSPSDENVLSYRCMGAHNFILLWTEVSHGRTITVQSFSFYPEFTY